MPPTFLRRSSRGVSLGHGEFPEGGPVTFYENESFPAAKTLGEASPKDKTVILRQATSISDTTSLESPSSSGSDEECPSVGTVDTLESVPSSRSLPCSKEKKSPLRTLSKKLTIRRPVKFERRVSSFMRSADLGLSELKHSFQNDDDEVHPNFHHPSVNPPPDLKRDENETWVALDNGAGFHSPVAPIAIQALAETGLNSTMNQSMWTAEKKTEKVMKRESMWKTSAWQEEGLPKTPPRGSPEEKEVLVWTGSFNHNYYGCDLPAVRAMGTVHTSPKELFDLLVDSTRVKEYNKMSLGRKDLLELQNDFSQDGPFGRSVTKVIQSESKPPLLRKTLRFVSLLHAKEIDGGYLIVTRAVTQASDSGAVDSSILCSEILLGVNVIRKIEGDDSRCLLTNVNHVRSPMVPVMAAKKLGLSAAVNFIHDIRKVF